MRQHEETANAGRPARPRQDRRRGFAAAARTAFPTDKPLSLNANSAQSSQLFTVVTPSAPPRCAVHRQSERAAIRMACVSGCRTAFSNGSFGWKTDTAVLLRRQEPRRAQRPCSPYGLGLDPGLRRGTGQTSAMGRKLTLNFHLQHQHAPFPRTALNGGAALGFVGGDDGVGLGVEEAGEHDGRAGRHRGGEAGG